MATIIFENVGICAMAAAVPHRVINSNDYNQFFTSDEINQVVGKIGVYQRRFVDPGVCSSDLCFEAAEKIIMDMQLERSEIDLLVFVSQTPDYRMPATSILLQDRLRLSHNTVAFDLTLGCSGFIYGLSVVYSMMEHSNLRKALLLDGETRSRVYSPKDRQTAFLFGDGGTASLIERSPYYGKSYFSLNSDGSKEDLIKIKAGGYRVPSTPDTIKERIVDEYGNIRSDEQGYMKGSEVFTFVIKEIPTDIKKVLELSANSLQDIDYFVFHQANQFINSHLTRKLRLDPTKVPATIGKYGNTSSVSVPLTIVSELRGKIDNKKILMSAFGVGMSWASCLINTGTCRICDIIEY